MTMRQAPRLCAISGKAWLSAGWAGRQVEAIKPQEVAGSWLTGISEVQLPAQYKLQNIEETEAAKLRLLRPSGSSECAQTHPRPCPSSWTTA